MDENIVFTDPSIAGGPKPLPKPPVSPRPSQPPSLPPSSPKPPPELVGKGGSGLSIVVKILIGLGIFLFLVVLLVWFIILPMLSKNGSSQVELLYWGLWEDEKIMKPILEEFERKNPNITVKYERREIKQYRDTLLVRGKNGNGPDVFRFHNTWLSELDNSVVPLPQDVITPEEFKKVYFPVVQADLVRNGAIYGIPFGMDTLSMFVNTRMLESIGETVPEDWDSFTSVAKKMTVKDQANVIKTAGTALGAYDNVTHAPDIFSLLFIQNRVHPTRLAENQQGVVEALQFYTDFVTGDDGIEKMWHEDMPQSLLAFTDGNVGIYFGYSWDIFTIKSRNPDLAFSVHPVPQLTDKKVTIASYWVDGVSAYSKHKKEAFLLMRYLARKETQQKIYTESSKVRLFGEPYARRDLSNTLKDNKLVYPFVKQAEYAVSSYFASNTHDNGVNEQLNAYLGNAVRGIIGNTSAESSANTLTSGAASVYKKYGIQ